MFGTASKFCSTTGPLTQKLFSFFLWKACRILFKSLYVNLANWYLDSAYLRHDGLWLSGYLTTYPKVGHIHSSTMNKKSGSNIKWNFLSTLSCSRNSVNSRSQRKYNQKRETSNIRDWTLADFHLKIVWETFTIRATFTVTAQHSWIFSPLDFTQFNIPVSSINHVITNRSQICNAVYFQQIIDSAQQGPTLHVVSCWEHFKSTNFMQILLSRSIKATKNVSFKHFDNYL